jgi:uncharacterized protein (DUF4213/DUF364 family)
VVYETPKIKEKLDNYDGDPRIKKLLLDTYEKVQTNKIIPQSETSMIKACTSLVEEYIGDENSDLMDICEERD